MGAALFMVLTRTALRESLWSEEDAGRALERTNAIISEDVRGGMFLTLFLAILSPESGHIQAANAGHVPPIHYHAAHETLAMISQRNMPLGIIRDMHFDSWQVSLRPGDSLVLVTDGLMETFSPSGEIFGLRRIAECVYKNRNLSARALINALLDAAMNHAQGEPFEDDLTIVIIKREGVQEEWMAAE
jgi:sigma-B regulation protein RsbU (phosphoserine phosphatase)